MFDTCTTPDESDLRSCLVSVTTSSYETTAPNGTVVEVTHNLDTGEASYHWTDRRGTPLSTGA